MLGEFPGLLLLRRLRSRRRRQRCQIDVTFKKNVRANGMIWEILFYLLATPSALPGKLLCLQASISPPASFRPPSSGEAPSRRRRQPIHRWPGCSTCGPVKLSRKNVLTAGISIYNLKYTSPFKNLHDGITMLNICYPLKQKHKKLRQIHCFKNLHRPLWKGKPSNNLRIGGGSRSVMASTPDSHAGGPGFKSRCSPTNFQPVWRPNPFLYPA